MAEGGSRPSFCAALSGVWIVLSAAFGFIVGEVSKA
jgi:hypothetical protein